MAMTPAQLSLELQAAYTSAFNILDPVILKDFCDVEAGVLVPYIQVNAIVDGTVTTGDQTGALIQGTIT